MLFYRAKQEKHKYRLYALRDKILLLVARRKIDEDSLIFKVFYDVLIKTICEVKQVKLWSIAHASVTAKSALQEERSEQLKTEMIGASPEVKEFVVDFYQTMMEIAVANSPLLVLFIRLANHSDSIVSKVGLLIRRLRLFLNETQQYDVYRYFEKQSHSA
jgi:hypothetical protein